MRKIIIIFISSLFFAPLCILAESNTATDPSGLHIDWIDTSADPQKNFYKYANGGWRNRHHIPSDSASLDTLGIIAEDNILAIKNIIEGLIQNPTYQAGSEEQKIVDLYQSGLDETTINNMGIRPLQAELDMINNMKNLFDLQKMIIHLQMMGVSAPFYFGPGQDINNSERFIGMIYWGGLGLPGPEYYSDKFYGSIRQSYVSHIANVFVLLGDRPDQAKIKSRAVLAIESQLAKELLNDMKDVSNYNIRGINILTQHAGSIKWTQYFSDLGHPEIKEIRFPLHFISSVSAQMKSRYLNDWKAYLRWHLVHAFARNLSEPYVQEDFRMTQVLSNIKTLPPRWKRVIQTENNLLGFAIGKLYVAQYFTPSTKLQAEEMIYNIRTALKNSLQNLAWMSPQTRAAALNKLDKMYFHVGCPDQWPDYTGLEINQSTYVSNIITANRFYYKRSLDIIGRPVNKSAWHMTPQTANAEYDLQTNGITIPAGILQPPLFNPNALAAVNYAALGYIVGHEITHGFDNYGSNFDENGNKKEWWTQEDRQKFSAQMECIANQFSQYPVLSKKTNNKSILVDGRNVENEAIADLGGLTLAYRAFHASDAYKQATIFKGFTPDQQFFIAAAHTWASKMHSQERIMRAVTDPHPPGKFRINGTFANMPEFQEAFDIPSGTPMVNAKRCAIW